MKERKWFGFGNRAAKPQAADLALFCPACPQPGINLPDNWKDDARTWLYWRGYVADGNFVAVHQFQARSTDDVWIKNGESFMTERIRYEQHIAEAVEHKEVRRTVSQTTG
jgi:hypothetical protein